MVSVQGHSSQGHGLNTCSALSYTCWLLALLVLIWHWLSAFTHVLLWEMLFLVQRLPPAACFSRKGLDVFKYLDKVDMFLTASPALRCLKVVEMIDLGV